MRHHPAALNGVLEFGEPARACLLISNGNGPFTFSIWMRPSCAASTPLAISISLRAAVLVRQQVGINELLHASRISSLSVPPGDARSEVCIFIITVAQKRMRPGAVGETFPRMARCTVIDFMLGNQNELLKASSDYCCRFNWSGERGFCRRPGTGSRDVHEGACDDGRL